MSVALRSLLELRALLDSLRPTRDSRFSWGPVFDPNKRMIPRRGVCSGGAARMEPFETECSVPGEELAGGLSTTARRTCPSTQSRNCHEPIFQIHSEVVQNVAGSCLP